MYGLDYLGTAVPRGKKLVVYGSTGKHFGYDSELGSTVIAGRLCDSKPSRLRLLASSMAVGLKIVYMATWPVFGAIAATCALEQVGALPMANASWFGGPDVKTNIAYLLRLALNSSANLGGFGTINGTELVLFPLTAITALIGTGLYVENLKHLESVTNYNRSMQYNWEDLQRKLKSKG